MRLNINNLKYQLIAYVAIISGLCIGAWFTRDSWLTDSNNKPDSTALEPEMEPPAKEILVLKLSEQARLNLGLRSASAKAENYWRTIDVPGVIVDRPGITDNGITSPLAGVVTKMHALEGDIVQPGQKLFSIRLISDYLQRAQLDLFKAIREIEILKADINRLRPLADSGAVPGSRLIELEQQIKRQNSLIEGQRQDLLSRGLSSGHLKQIEAGEFLTNIDIFVPEIASSEVEFTTVSFERESANLFEAGFFEVQSLKVSLGQQVDAGQLLAVLANHNTLYLKGIAFKKESSVLARAAERGWRLQVDFTDDAAQDWPEQAQEFQIRHMANTADASSRTFDFFVPLLNQFRTYENGNRLFVLWRYRPGQRVRIQVPVEELNNVMVLPAEAVVFEGPEAYVFQQNGDLFNRISVRVLHQDRLHVVIANDGAIQPGHYVAQGSASSLNRVLKAQAASGMRADIHVHADGTTHAAH
jgi:membrane fusion protein, heavy metal efflux system